MKTIKFILATVMMMVAFTVQAQTVQVYKDGAVVKEYPASEVKDVQVKQVYYYYAGWECPTNEDDLKSKGTLIGSNYDTFVYSFVDNPVGPNKVDGITTADYYYVIIPVGMKIYDQIGTNVTSSAFEKHTTWSNHIVYKSVEDTAKIKAIIIKK